MRQAHLRDADRPNARTSTATIETTELLRLADDTSNDFSLPNVPRQAASIAVAEFREPYPHTAPTLKGQGCPNFRPQTAIVENLAGYSPHTLHHPNLEGLPPRARRFFNRS